MSKYMSGSIFIASLALAGSVCASAANAGVYDFSFSAADGDAVYGKFTTNGSDVISASGNAYLPVLDSAMCCGFVNNGVSLGGAASATPYTTPSGDYIVDDLYAVDYYGLYLTTFGTREINIYAGTAAAGPDGYVSETISAGQGPKSAYVGIYDPSSGIDAQEFGTLTITGVPEPSTWAMMLLGFAGLGFAGYRKAKSGTAAFASA
jgi:hypothetical protein